MKKVALLGFAILFLVNTRSICQSIELVKDINDAPLIPNIQECYDRNILTINGITFFAKWHPYYGIELWKTDGTPDGSTIVKDLQLASGLDLGNGDPVHFNELNGTLHFFATSNNVLGLWKSDGTESGTLLIKVISNANIKPTESIVLNGQLFFTADNTVNGLELWKSDGTTAGTIMVKDIRPGATSSDIRSLTIVGSTLFFAATDGSTALPELWKSDGTEIGTQLVKYINGAGGSDCRDLVEFNGELFFAANDGVNGRELWKSDGSLNGTMIVKDINAPTHSNPNGLSTSNGTLYFTADDGVHGPELWKSDGTEAGTEIVLDIFSGNPGSSPRKLTNVNGTVFFVATDDSHGQELWKSDGTISGTVLVKDITPGTAPSSLSSLLEYNNQLIFLLATLDSDRLWRSDGSDLGTFMLENINIEPTCIPGIERSERSIFASSTHIYFFGSKDEQAVQLWQSNGTTNGIQKLTDLLLTESSSIIEMVNYNNVLFLGMGGFTANSQSGLWKSDGTELGTLFLSNISADHFTISNSILFFRGFDGSDYGLWKTDGTSNGTVVLLNDVDPKYLTDVNGLLYFNGGGHLWISDGSPAGTTIVKNSIDPEEITYVNGTIFFTADDGINGRELWKSDGTESGTVIVHDFLVGSSNPYGLTSFLGELYLAANGGQGYELWKSNGTPGIGTVLVKDINPNGPGSNSNPDHLEVVGDLLFFTADDGVHLTELWRSDGTTGGTQMVKDIFPLSASVPQDLTNVGGILFFSCYTLAYLNELWRSDGTEDGTYLVKDINPNLSSYPMEMTQIGCDFYFSTNGASGRELWKSDGNAGGTALIGDINPVGPDDVRNLVHINGTIYFTATNGLTGQELYKYTPILEGAPSVSDIKSLQSCSHYILPSILGTNLSGNQAYYTESHAAGTKHPPGDTIFSTTILFAYDAKGVCYDETSFSIEFDINPGQLCTKQAGPPPARFWSHPGSWSPEVPGACDDVVIPDNNQDCIVDIDAYCNTLEILLGATFEISPGKTIQVGK